MPAPPRLRQLRRDKVGIGFVLNVVRLDLEDDERLDQNPALANAPDEALRHLRNIRHYWLGVTAIYVMRKSRCSPEAAVRVVTELREELAETMPDEEIRAVSLREALDVPSERLPTALRPPTAESPPA